MDWLRVILLFSLLYSIQAQIDLLDQIGKGGGIPYPNQVTDIGVACLQYEPIAKVVCRPTPTEWAPLQPKCNQYRLYCKGLQAPPTGAPDINGLLPPPPPDVCPQVIYCSTWKSRYQTNCAQPANQDEANFCKIYPGYCTNVPEDQQGLCAQRATAQPQDTALLARQRLLAQYPYAYPQPYGNPLPLSLSQRMPGTNTNTGRIGW